MAEQPQASTDESGEVFQDSIPRIYYSTRNLAKSEQFDGWRQFISSTVDLSQLEGGDNGFEAEQEVWNLGGFALTRAAMPGAGHARMWRHLNKDPLDHWCLVVVDNAADAGQTGAGEPRLIGFRSLARPFEGAGADRHVVSLFAPRDAFRGLTSAFDAADAIIPDTGLGAMLADYILSLQRRLPSVTQAETSRVVDATRAMIAACLAPTADHRAAAQSCVAATLLERANQIIRNDLGSPLLGADFLCRSLGVSRSRLYRLFELSGGVAHAIQRQRLLKAHEILSDPNNGRPIVRLAESLGFSDASAFSRSFKREFGYCPSEARGAGVLGLSPPSPARTHEPSHAGKLGDVLRALQG